MTTIGIYSSQNLQLELYEICLKTFENVEVKFKCTSSESLMATLALAKPDILLVISTSVQDVSELK